LTRWTVHGERKIYESDWVTLALADVELPDGNRFEHHLVRIPQQAAAVIVHDSERGVLMLWRHRFITDTWGWEVPAGRIEPGETPRDAAARETLEETGWAPGPLRSIGSYHPANGFTDQTFHVFVAAGATHVGEPDGIETDRVEWIALDSVRRLIRSGDVSDGFSLTSLLWYLAL
jgi:8-oxo-dGTP pyrophosphatase MutT (NUDIX family)